MAQIKGLIKDETSVLLSNNSQSFSVISKKTGRLASAIYLLTDFLSDIEPLKWSIRKWSLRIITRTLSLKSVYTAEQKIRQLESIKVDIERVSSLLETAQRSGLISEMNFRIILGELVNLTKLEEQYVNISLLSPKDEGYNLTEGFLDGAKGELEIKDTMSYRNVLYNKEQSVIKDKLKDTKPSKFGDHGQLGQIKEVMKQVRAGRQMRILDIIRDKKEVTIKDIVSLIKDCSEKTIQRELGSMINSGVLRRSGRRRWSKYSLNL